MNDPFNTHKKIGFSIFNELISLAILEIEFSISTSEIIFSKILLFILIIYS